MKKIITLVMVVLGSWLTTAIFDFWPRDQHVVYSVRDTELPLDGKPALTPVAPKTYGIRDNKVYSLNAGASHTYDNCEISSINNWNCENSDATGEFGMKDGHFWEIPERSDIITISPFRYHVLSCQWDWFGGPTQMVSCVLRPFTG